LEINNMKIFSIKTTIGVAIMRLIDEAQEASTIAQFKASCPGMYVSHREIQESDLPADRSTRGQWVDTGSEIIAQ
jgi:hypothetical protein